MRERRWTHRVLLVLIACMTVSSVVGFTPKLDLGVFATLVGADLAVLGVGSVIRFVGRDK